MKFPAAIRLGLHPVTVQLFAVAVGSLAVAAIGLAAMTYVQARANSAADNTSAQLLAGGIVIKAGETRRLMLANPAIYAGAAAGDKPIRSEIPLHVAVEEASLLRDIDLDARQLHQIAGTQASLELLAAAGDSNDAFKRYLESNSMSDLAVFSRQLDAANLLAAETRTVMADAAARDEQRVRDVASLTRVLLLVTPLLCAMAVGATTFAVGRRLSRALQQSRAEQEALRQSTRVMERRNGQFEALYQIVSEVSETLSMTYVVQTTVREARRLVQAEVVELRLLRGGELVLAGIDQDIAESTPTLGPVALGEGYAGRAAKRGRTVRVDSGADALMAPGEHLGGAQSGVVVPLIVGARVVGTMACWSDRPGLFTDDDARVLEMMASQVATAVVAASTHEATEHQALHDALTGLPNRRQLTRDIQERFEQMLMESQPCAFAMVDIDHFKRFNDEFGHKVGDITLQRVAEVLRTAVRETDSVYRYGGEEFAIILPGADLVQASQRLDHVRAAVAATPLTGEHLEPVGPVTISIGVAAGPWQGDHAEALIKLADIALYQSKWAGRDRVTRYDPAIESVPELDASKLPRAA
jgi:diguanylate cyclase (GGDEF)-like protein